MKLLEICFLFFFQELVNLHGCYGKKVVTKLFLKESANFKCQKGSQV